MSMSYLDEVFSANGYLSKCSDSYQPRKGQVALANAIENAIANKRHLLAEGPTGTGKGLAYLVPAIYHAVHNDKKATIVTANIALQEQLITKDLPRLEKALPWKFRYALLKGKSNYACLKNVYEMREEALTDDERAIYEWTLASQTGDVSELSYEPAHDVWRQFAASPDACLGKECPCKNDCFYRKAVRTASEAEIVVTNYHLFFTPIGEYLLIPNRPITVLDEGHKAADIARDFFGFTIKEGSFKHVGHYLTKISNSFMGIRTRLLIDSEMFMSQLKSHFKSPSYKARIRQPNIAPCWPSLKDSLLNVLRVYEDEVQTREESHSVPSQLRMVYYRTKELLYQLEMAMSLEDPNRVYFIEDAKNDRVQLVCKPVYVGDLLRQHLFDRVESCTVTSATLTTSNGSFEYIANELGLDDRDEVVGESPFDWANQCALVVPAEMPEPNSPQFPAAMTEAVAQVIEQAKGRTLGLFTSWKNLKLAYERLRSCGYRVLKQGDAPRTKLIEAFKQDTSSVLLGVESFWAGVDVPGESLSCVIIDKLPFPTPDDPILNALEEHEPNVFQTYSVPRAVIAFKQGFGRLIRSKDDHGVVVLLDRRVFTKGYGDEFLNALPSQDIGVTDLMEGIGLFLNG